MQADSLPAEPQCFPDSLVGKEFTSNAGDPSSIPRSGRSPGEGIGYPLQHFWASLVAQLVRNLPAMQETWVRSLGWEHPLKKLYVSGNKIQMTVRDALIEIKNTLLAF